MADAIFPEFTASAVDGTQADALPMLRECAWDLQTTSRSSRAVSR